MTQTQRESSAHQFPHWRSWGWYVPKTPVMQQFDIANKSARQLTLAVLFDQKWATILRVVCGMSASFFSALVPISIARIIDSSFSQFDIVLIAMWIVVLLALLAAQILLEAHSDAFDQLAVAREEHTLRSYFNQRLTHASKVNQGAGTILNTVDADVTVLTKVRFVLGFPLVMLSYLAGSMISIWNISWPIAIMFLVGGVLTMLASTLTTAPATKIAEKRREKESIVAAYATDLAQGARVVKGLGAVKTSKTNLETKLDDALAVGLRENRIVSALGLIRQYVPAICIAIILSYALHLAVSDRISGGEFSAITLLAAPALQALGLSLEMAANWWAQAKASAQRLINLANAIDNTPMEVEAVPFAKNTPLEIWPQDQASQAKLRMLEDNPEVLTPPHEAHLFETTLRDNIDPLQQYSDVQVLTALRIARCHDIVQRLGGNLDAGVFPETAIGEAGLNLSGGQRQRVAIARAIAAQPEVLALDDPATGLDALTLDQVIQGLKDERRNDKTIVLSNNRLWRSAE